MPSVCRWALWALVAITVVVWSAFVLVLSADLDIALPGSTLDPSNPMQESYDAEQSYVKPVNNMLDSSSSTPRHRPSDSYGL